MVRAVVVTQEEVTQLAKELISKGEKPTIGRVRELLGNRGSPNTISRYLKDWRDGEIDHIRHGDEDSMDAVADFTAAPPKSSTSVDTVEVASKPVVKRTQVAKPNISNQSDAVSDLAPVKASSPQTQAQTQVQVHNQIAMSDLNAVNPVNNTEVINTPVNTEQHAESLKNKDFKPKDFNSGSPQQNSTGTAGKMPVPTQNQAQSQNSQNSQSSQKQNQTQGQNQASSAHRREGENSQNSRNPKNQPGQQGNFSNANQNNQNNQGNHQQPKSNQSNQANHQKSQGHSQHQSHHQSQKQNHQNQKNYDKPQDRPHVPKPALMFEDNFPNVYVSENLDTLTSTQLVAKVRRLESILNKELSRRESADSMARDAKEYAEAVKVQVGARINDIRQSMEMVIDSLQSQLKSMRENAEKDLRFYRDSLEKAKEKLAQYKMPTRGNLL